MSQLLAVPLYTNSLSLSVLFVACLQEMVHAKDPPAHYLTKLRTYLDPKASRSHRVSIVFVGLLFVGEGFAVRDDPLL